jgi:Protein of unknown function (DUF3108)
MRKAAVVVLCLATGCGEPKYVAKPLPDLIANPKRMAISVPALLMPDGERLRWEVHHKGFTIGSAEMVVSGSRISSRFKTSQLASMFAKASHELTTSVAHAGTYPDYASERAEVNGEKEAYEISFDGSVYMIGGKGRRIADGVGHTMHTALGVLRAWASPKAKPGYINVLHAGELFHFDVDTPTAEDWRGTKTLKIEGRILGAENKPILVTIWLTDDKKHIPSRIAISADGKQLDAEKIDD